MNIEILEFYPIERSQDEGFLSGTLRIRLPSLGIDILGIYAVRNKSVWSFSLPRGKSIHHDTGGICFYPFLSFNDKEKQKELMETIKEKGKAFIEAGLASGEPLVFPGKPSFLKKQASAPKSKNVAKEAKENPAVVKSKPMASIVNNVWVDLPPLRKSTAFQKARTGRRF